MEPRAEDFRRSTATELAARALEGRAAAWDELVRRHSRRVRLSLLAKGVAWDVAEDLVQETWMRLIHQQRAGRLRALELPGLAIAQAGWLAREALRTVARRQAIAPTSTLPDPALCEWPAPEAASDPAAGVEHEDRVRIARRVLADCPPRMRRVVLRAYGSEGGTHADVARDLGLSVQRVRQTLCEARARMRRAIAELEPEGDA